MWGPATAIALSEMHRVAEESVLKVRGELFRLGFSGVILVEQKGVILRLLYNKQRFVADPLALLAVLREIHEVESADALWHAITQGPGKEQNCTRNKLCIVMLLCIALLVVMVLIMHT